METVKARTIGDTLNFYHKNVILIRPIKYFKLRKGFARGPQRGLTAHHLAPPLQPLESALWMRQ